MSNVIVYYTTLYESRKYVNDNSLILHASRLVTYYSFWNICIKISLDKKIKIVKTCTDLLIFICKTFVVVMKK